MTQTDLITKKARLVELDQVIDDARASARAEVKSARWRYGDIIRKAMAEKICLQAEIDQAEG